MDSILLLLLGLTGVLAQFTNLPDVSEGVFNVSASIDIENTSIDAAWDALTDFVKYPEWNPFVRSSIAVDAANLSLPIQRPVVGNQLLLRVQIPPLPLPVNKYTLDNPLATQISYENVTHVQRDLGRLAWVAYPNPLITAERWQALSDLGEGKVRYESREVFSGPAAGITQKLLQDKLRQSFAAQAAGLKLRLERA